MHYGDWRETKYGQDQLVEQYIKIIDEYVNAIRKHRDQKGDDRCWMDDEELYKTLPEGYTPPIRDTTVELCNCVKFITNRTNPNTCYVSPQRRIEELEARVKELETELNECSF